jgi:UTP:GlnB (protein PII) uridylyltransferase
VATTEPEVRFEQVGSKLTAIEITRAQRSPVIAALQRALFALGIVVSSYQARTRTARLIERVVIERTDGGDIDGALSAAAKSAILPIALEQSQTADQS